MQFLNPALLAGALLFAVPLIIHLLNRQRHRRLPWAAMEFLLRAYQKQRARLRNENLLLLLLRCLLPIVLALAIARPVWNQVVGLFRGAGTVHHLMIVDASYSMGLRLGGAPTPYERARTMVGRLLDRFEQTSSRSDKVTIVSAGVRPRFLVRGDLDLAAARQGWLQLQKPEDAAGSLTEALQQTAAAIEEANDPLAQIYVFTDLQVAAFGDALATPAEPAERAEAGLKDGLRDAVERLTGRDGVQLHWIDVGPLAASRLGGIVDNVQITDLRLAEPAAVQRAPVEVLVAVRNLGQVAANCEVTLDIDGGEPLRKLVEVPAGAELEVDFQVTLREIGQRRLRAALANDALAADDERFLVVAVRDRIRILLVDGEAGGDALRSYAHLFEAMLDPDAAVLPTFAVDTVDIVALLGGQCTPKDYDVVILADVERLSQRAVAALGDALAAGRGLFVALGERVAVDDYNLHLFAAGDGPMPFRLLQPLGGAPGGGTVRQPTIAAPEHPLLREFEDEIYREVLQAIPLWRWHGIAEGSLADGATVVLAVADAARSPLLVARDFGEGKAVFLTSAIASEYKPDRWNRLDDPIVAFPLLHGMVRWLSLPARDPFAALVGAELTCSVPARPENVEVLRPERDGRSRAPLGEDPRPLPGGRFLLPPLANPVYAGFYVFDLNLESDTGKEAASLSFAVNVETAEGELRYANHVDARSALGIERVLDALPVVGETADEPDRSELGPSLLLATLLLVLGEGMLAQFVAKRRS